MIKTFNYIFLILVVLFCQTSFPADQEIKEKAATYNQQAINALQKNDYTTAIDYFTRALQLLPDNPIIRKNLALTYNNYAIDIANKNQIEDAKELLYKAIEIDNDNSHFKENLANLLSRFAAEYYKNGNYEFATYKLKEALALLPNHVPSLVLLGQVYYQTQDLANAEKIWNKAFSLDPKNKDLKEMLKKLRSETKIESSLKKLDAYYFDIRFDKEAIDSEVYDVKSFLQDAYRDIGRDFNYYPHQKMPVILYTQEDFQNLRHTPEWVAGIYDGKIRLPIRKNGMTDTEFKRLIWHEYTHSVVFALTDGKCPVWFNEGLAKYEESKIEKPDLAPLFKMLKDKSYIPLANLNSYFSMQTKPELLNLAYLEAYTFIDFILDRWNFHLVKNILVKIKNGKSIDKAFYDITNRTSQQIEKEWIEFIQNY
jgi:tetratricopeptide (TPR) repeat protein